MADNDKSQSYIRETRTTESSGPGMALIVGGLVVAVGFIVWLVFGNSGTVATTEPASTTTNVTIEPPAAPPADATTAAPAEPATEPAAPAEPAAPTEGSAAPAAPATNP